MRKICNMWVNLRSHANRPMSKQILLVFLLAICPGVICQHLQAQAAFDQARRLSDQNQYLAAIDLLHTYIDEHPDRRYDNAKAWWLVSYNLLQLNDFNGAEAANDSSLALRAAILSDEVAENYLRSGVIALQRGNFSKALSDLNRAGDLPIEDPLLYALVFAYRGQVLSELARWPEADQAFSDAREMLVITEGEQHPDLASLYYDQARSWLLRENPDTALSLLNQALSIAQATNGRADLKGRIINALAKVHQKEQPQLAERYYRQAWQLFRATYGPHHRELARVRLNLAEFYLAQEQPQAIQPQLDSAILHLCPELSRGELPTPATSTFDRAMLAEILRRKAWLWADALAADSLRTAYSMGTTAATIYLNHLATLQDEADQLSYRQQWGDVFEPAIFAALRLQELHGETGLLQRAFSMAERAKSASLKAQLRLSAQMPLLDQLRRSMRKAEAHWATNPNDEQARRQAQRARIAWETEWQNLQRTQPNWYNSESLWASPPTADSLAAQLKPHQALLSYYLGKDHYYLFCITTEGLQAYSLPNDYYLPARLGKSKLAGRLMAATANGTIGTGPYSSWTTTFRLPDLHESIQGVRQALRTNDAQRYAAHAGNLYIKLIQPIQRHLNKKTELIISSHGALTSLPFEALVSDYLPDEEGDKTIKFHKLNYLGSAFAIRYTYTLDAQGLLRAAARHQSWLGVAPIFAAGTSTALLSEESREILPANPGATTPDGLSFAALPYTEGEVQQIARLFGTQSTTLLHQNATEEQLQATIDSFDIIHLATHSFVNRQEPLLSGIALAQPQGPSREDGICYAAEVLAMKLRGQLVTLSSCDSGVGPDGQSEGPISLSRAFLRAGASGVVGSLWKVYDEHTATLMTDFYTHLQQGQQPAQALQQARQKLIRHKRTANPRLWAGFVYIE